MRVKVIVDIRDGKTAYGFRPYCAKASLAWFLAKIDVGEHLDLTRMIKVDGSDMPPARVQILVPVSKQQRSKFRTSVIGKTLRVWRVA